MSSTCPALERLLRDLHSRRLSLVEVETPTASPFASSLLFDYVATYMYEGDTPNAERRAAALALDRDLLRELLGQEELRELIDPEALVEVEASLQHRTEAGRAQGPRRASAGAAPPRRPDRGGVRGAGGRGLLGGLDAGEAGARAPRRPGPDRRRGALDRRRGRRALPRRARRAAAGGLPESFLAEVPDAMLALVRRYARTHGPFPTAQLAARYGIDPLPALRELERAGELVRGELLPGGTEREWCDADVLRRLRRASLAHLRRRPRPSDPRELARFLPGWQNVDAHRPAGAGPRPPARGPGAAPGRAPHARGLGARRAAATPGRLQPGLARRALHQAASWSGSAPGRSAEAAAGSPSTSARTCASPGRRPANAKLEPPEGEVHDAIRERLAQAPRFWLDLVADLDCRARGAPRRALGPRLGRRGDQRRVRSPARPAALAPCAARNGAGGASPRRRAAGRAGGRRALVADRAAVRGRSRGRPPPARPGRADARALRDRHPRDGAGRGRARRLRDPLRRAVEPGDARHRSSRLLRRGTRRRAVRARRRCRAPARPARRRRPATWSWPPPIRPTPTARRCPGRSASRPAAGVPAAPLAPTCCFATASRSSTSSGAAAASSASLELDAEALAAAVAELAAAARAGRLPKLGIERLDGEPVIGSGLEDDPDRGWIQPPASPARRLGLSGDRRSRRDNRHVAGDASATVELLSRRAAVLRAVRPTSWSGSRRWRFRAPSRAGSASSTRATSSDACYIVRQGDLPGHARALRRAGDRARDARPRRHLRRAGDARRRGSLGERRDAVRLRAARASRRATSGACSPTTRRSR